ncbi:MAG: hypothetical protein JO021_17415, partial [Alphaproteobacteria bacterium]|nr:hypothetical protein [Alphaproteobacteria bacterium]
MPGGPALIFLALEAWFSSTRLPRRLAEAGFDVVLMCTAESPLMHVSSIDQRVVIRAEDVATALAAACARHDVRLIVPADEEAVAALGRLVRGDGGALAPALAEVIVRSVGAPARVGAGAKANVNGLAAQLGIAVPRQAVVDSAAAACALAHEVGYPIVIKKDQTFGGMGVMRCASDRDTLVAWYRLHARNRWQRGLARLGSPIAHALPPVRDWLMRRPSAPLIAQKFVGGRIGFRTFVADRGRVLAGITAVAEAHNPAPFGASSVVRFIDHPEIERATAALARALELSGFGGVDFIFEAGTERPYLLELNARVTPIAHLGKRLGVDLCAALHAALTDAPIAEPEPMDDTVVALFPSELERDPDSRWIANAYHDVPWDEPALLAA